MDQQQNPESSPSWQAPPQQAPPANQWQSPPQQAPAAWGQQGYVARPVRPGGVTFAGVYLIVLGVFFLLIAALAFVGGAALGSTLGDQFGGMLAAAAAIAAILFLVMGLAQLIGGIGALQGKGWARMTGIIASVIVLIFLVLGLPASLSGQGSQTTGLIINIVLIAGYVVAIWALAKAGSYFAYRR